MDIQADFRLVWSGFLYDLNNWINHKRNINPPRNGYINAMRSVNKTLIKLNHQNDFLFSKWFKETIEAIINNANGNHQGNLSKMLGKILEELADTKYFINESEMKNSWQ